jgi:glycosyltransferase involved in cell wall biosynthesis
MATYNGEKYINEQIDSLLNQTYTNWKLIIHDDNSTDKTVSIIKEYTQKYPKQIELIDDNISTGEVKENFTFLLENIDNKYDYIMFSDQDDVWLSEKIELSLNVMKELENENSKDMPLLVFTDLDIVDEELRSKGKSMLQINRYNYKKNNIYKLMTGNYITGCTILFNKNSMNYILPISKEATMHDFWIAIIIAKFGKVKVVEKSLILYRQHSLNLIGIDLRVKTKFNKLFNIFNIFLSNYSMIKSLPFKVNFYKYVYFFIKEYWYKFIH